MRPLSLLCLLCALLTSKSFLLEPLKGCVPTRCSDHSAAAPAFRRDHPRQQGLLSYALKPHLQPDDLARSSRESIKTALLQLVALPVLSIASRAGGEEADGATPLLLVNLNSTQPRITDTCYLDIKIGSGETADVKRIEIALFGDVLPITCENFKKLCETKLYKNSDVFRIIPTFSIQAGNIGQPADARRSEYGNYGRSAVVEGGKGFPAENFNILHSCAGAGVVSMMKDVRNKGLQDSRFFVTLSPFASWADGRYVAFGRVTKGMDTIAGLSVIPTVAPSNYPETSVKIIDCGVL